jgi:hypothetical protein
VSVGVSGEERGSRCSWLFGGTVFMTVSVIVGKNPKIFRDSEHGPQMPYDFSRRCPGLLTLTIERPRAARTTHAHVFSRLLRAA